LPLKGKILNVERARFDRIISSKEVGTLIQALGTGIRDEFNLQKLRYHKIVIMTDADVDGAHIRTLLLTFFYRQMPDIIEAGHLYIAQPPLYKVSKGRSEVYLKDDAALENYLVDAAIDSLRLEGPAGGRSGKDLAAIIDHARRVRALMRYVPRRYPAHLIEALALGGAFDPALDAAGRSAAAARVAPWLDTADAAASGTRESKWTVSVGELGYTIERRWRGVSDHFVIDSAFLASQEARRLHGLLAAEAESYAAPMQLARLSSAALADSDDGARDDDSADAPTTRKAANMIVTRPSELLEAVLTNSRKGLKVQRYKGLGEMNAEQLWETTLDPAVRTLLRVEADQADVAHDIFERLMGDEVEPRREFIQDNALSVANLDV
jgi:DNA gyrase subunit B